MGCVSGSAAFFAGGDAEGSLLCSESIRGKRGSGRGCCTIGIGRRGVEEQPAEPYLVLIGSA